MAIIIVAMCCYTVPENPIRSLWAFLHRSIPAPPICCWGHGARRHMYTYHSICICIIYIYTCIHKYTYIHIHTHTLSLSIYIYTFIYIWLVVSWFTVWTVLPENCEATYVVSSQLSEASAVFDSHANRIAFLVLHKSEARSMADCFEWSYHKWPKCVSKLPSFEPFSIH